MKLVLKIAAGIILALVVLIAGCTALVGVSASETSTPAAELAAEESVDAEVETTEESTESEETSDPAAEEAPEYTVAQENAIASAENYLEFSAFSRKGLIQQLSSEYGEGFKKADAIFAVKHIDVNWNEQAAKAAKNYLETSSFSRSGLIKQLESEYGEGFTHAQAVYGVNQTGL